MQQLEEDDFLLTDEQILEIIEKYVNKKETNYTKCRFAQWKDIYISISSKTKE